MKEYLSKDAETRTMEILAAALELFSQKGYESTTIDEIAAKVGVTKGSFYHHFRTKEAVLEAVADRLSAGVVEVVRSVFARNDLNAVEKVNVIVEEIYAYRTSRKAEYARLASFPPIHGKSSDAVPADRPMRKRLFEKVLTAAHGSYIEIIRQGVDEGLFDTEYPEEAAELFIRMADLLRYDLAALSGSRSRNAGVRRIRFYEQILERILGAPPGSFRFVEPVSSFFFPEQPEKGR